MAAWGGSVEWTMDLGLNGKIALVTGASKGIGLAAAQALAAEGARVALVARSGDALDEAVRGIESAGGEALAVVGDVGRADEVERVVAEVRRRLGDPQVLVANAGGPRAGTPSGLDEQAWADAVQLTLMSTVRLVQATLPAMRRGRWGRIVTITSLSVREPLLNLTLSNALRAGVTGYIKTLSQEVAAEGITANNVAPGYTATARLAELFADAAAERALVETIPAKRLGTPEEIAAAVAFLASEPAAYVTGQTLLVDGGIVKSLM